MKPIYITNAAGLRFGKGTLAGHGNAYTIMQKPRHFERGNGRVWPLVPEAVDLFAARSEFRTAHEEMIAQLNALRSAEERERDIPAIEERIRQKFSKVETETADRYRQAFVGGPARWCDGEVGVPCRRTHPHLAEGLLMAQTWGDTKYLYPVRPGDTLFCACARDRAAEGKCHRVWAAALLVDAGWTVILDGTPLTKAAAPDHLAWWTEAA